MDIGLVGLVKEVKISRRESFLLGAFTMIVFFFVFKDTITMQTTTTFDYKVASIACPLGAHSMDITENQIAVRCANGSMHYFPR